MRDKSSLFHHHGYFYLIRLSTTHQLSASLYLSHSGNQKAKQDIATSTRFKTFSNTYHNHRLLPMPVENCIALRRMGRMTFRKVFNLTLTKSLKQSLALSWNIDFGMTMIFRYPWCSPTVWWKTPFITLIRNIKSNFLTNMLFFEEKIDSTREEEFSMKGVTYEEGILKLACWHFFRNNATCLCN